MMAELYDDAPFDNNDWVFEVKYDGYRALTRSDGNGDVVLYSRNLKPLDDKFGAVLREMHKLDRACLLDGEVVIEDERGVSKFQLLQNLKQRGDELKYYVFDILELDGEDLTRKPLVERKELLQRFLKTQRLDGVHYSDHIIGSGVDFFDEARKHRLEGIMAKKADSVYRPGKRTDDWLKIKINFEDEAIIIGYTAPKGSRQLFGSLLLGMYENGELRYIGNCGTGFNDKTLREVYDKMQPLKTDKSPVNEKVKLYTEHLQWLKPKLVCQVKYTEWTTDGSLRHPVFLGLRFDKPATQVVKRKPVDMKVKTSAKKSSARNASPSKRSTRETSTKKSSDKTSDAEEIGDFVAAGKIKVKVTNRDKLYWQKEKITKGNLIDYYASVADYMLPFLKDRPQSMHRFPNGADKPAFFQKDVEPSQLPSFVRTEPMFSDSNNADIDFIVCDNKATLLYMANLGCIEIHPWNSRVQKPDNPDWLIIDLDPEDIDFSEVVKAALATKKVFDGLNMKCYVKTSGSTGIHVCVPLAAKYEYDVVRNFAELVARRVHELLPDTTSVERSPSKRKKKVYVDYLQNSRGQTLAAPYSVRPKPDATVSAPLDWKEVNGKLSPKNFTIHNMLQRIKKKGDMWKPVIGKGEDLRKALKTIGDTQSSE